MNVVEPCCLTKQLRSIIGDEVDYAGTHAYPVFHSGDVTAAMLLSYFCRRVSGYSPLTVGICLPFVDETTVEALVTLLDETVFCRRTGASEPLLKDVAVVTREPGEALLAMAASDARVGVARVTNLCTQMLTVTDSQSAAICAGGSLPQRVTPGWHQVTVFPSLVQHALMRPLVDSLMRTHRIAIR